MDYSQGERELQVRFGSEARALAFYENQVIDRLNEHMQAFIATQEMVFLSTADRKGRCDTSFRAGDPGFVEVVDAHTLRYPEYRGNGVYASLGNLMENPHIGLLFIDFLGHGVGLHVNGSAIIEELSHTETGDPRVERCVRITVEEAYIHCAKHIPLLQKRGKDIHWGTDDAVQKGGDYFKVKSTKVQAPR